ncbi:hypothetical protein [Kytococcus sedentarius]|uniref:hypothetical protein n=1 Tax=Kytococcus sedentarius TaxID=1276 RepID=UPI0035BC9335
MDLSGVVELSATGGLDGDTPTLVVRHEDCAVWNVGLRIDGDRWVPDQSDREEVAMVCPEPPASRAWVEEVVNGPFTVGPAPEGQWLLESGDASILLTNDSTRLELPAG